MVRGTKDKVEIRHRLRAGSVGACETLRLLPKAQGDLSTLEALACSRLEREVGPYIDTCLFPPATMSTKVSTSRMLVLQI